jgi:RNA polymerase sigma-70 factor (ECF subfamily)
MNVDDEFREFVDTYKSDAALVTRCILGRSSRVDDVVSLAFSTAWDQWSSRPAEAMRRPWIVAIARNHARNQRRIDISRRRYELAVEDVEIFQPEEFIESPRIALLRDVLMNLTTRELHIVIAVYWVELSHREVGDLLGMRETAVSMQLSRIRKKLRSSIEVRELFEGGANGRF